MNGVEQKKRKGAGFLHYLKVLVKRRMLIGGIVFTASLLAVIVSLLLPDRYVSATTILPPSGKSTALSQLAARFGGLGGISEVKSSGKIWLGILKSRKLRNAIVKRFNLMEVYDKKTLVAARGELNDNIKIWVSQSNGITTLVVEDESPERAAEMANALVEELDAISKRMVMSAGKRTRVFVEKRRMEVMVKLEGTEEALKKFQETNKAIALNEQSRAALSTIGRVKGELMGKKVELQALLSYALPTNPQAEILRAQTKELESNLRKLEEGESKPNQRNILIPTGEIPKLLLDYARLLREQRIQQSLYELLTQQYEMARIQEAKDSPIIQVLDTAEIPIRKTEPKRTLIVILSSITAAFYAIFMAFFIEYGYMEKVKNAAGAWKADG